MQHLNQASGNNEWYTPSPLVEAVREVLGEIKFDPCSTVQANEVVKARLYYTQEDDALSRDWCEGQIFMNPPYERGVIDKFVRKFCECEGDKIALVNNATETKWFQELAENCNYFCFLNRRVKFDNPYSGRNGRPLQGQVIVGRMVCWHSQTMFEHVFQDWGVVMNKYMVQLGE